MTLRTKHLEKAVLARIRTALRHDPQLREQTRRAPKSQRWVLTTRTFLFRALISFLLAWLVVAMHQLGVPAAAQSALAAVWFAVAAIPLRFRILALAYDLPKLIPFILLPTTREALCRWQYTRIIREAWRPGLDALAVLSTVTACHGAGPGAWLAVIPLALVTGMATLTVAFWLCFVRMPRQLAALPHATVLGLIAVAHIKPLRTWLGSFFVEHAEAFSLVSPAGWLTRAQLGLIEGDPLIAVPYLLTSLMVALSMIAAVRQWLRLYAPEVFVLWNAFGEAPPEIKELVNAQLERCQTEPPPANAAETHTANAFLNPYWPAPGSGWIDRQIARWLTPRELTLLEFAVAGPPDWSGAARHGTVLLGIGLGLLWLARQFNPTEAPAVLGYIAGGVIMFLGLAKGLPITTPFTRAFRLVAFYGTFIPFFAPFPVATSELLRVALKSGLVRAAAFTPVLLAAGAALGLSFGLNPYWCACAGVKCAVLSVLAIPWVHAFWLAGNSAAPGRFNFKTFCALMIMVGGFIGVVAGGAMAVFVRESWAWLGLALAGAASFGSAQLFMHMYARQWFDLTRPVN